MRYRISSTFAAAVPALLGLVCAPAAFPAAAGVVYKVDAAGRETVLYNFTGGSDGGYPTAGVTGDSAGNLYGATNYGGDAVSCPGGGRSKTPPGCGVVYRLDKAGNYTVLHAFTRKSGRLPYGGVILDSAGNLYGTTEFGGTADHGTVYKVTAKGHASVLHSFTGGSDGGSPFAGVVRDSAGNLYGTTYDGGTAGWGVVFKVDAAGHETVLYNFTGGATGALPTAGVVRDAAGTIFGTASAEGANSGGVAYTLDAAGNYTVLCAFADGPGGYLPNAVIRDSSGNLYGTATGGGNYGDGVVFELDATGTETVLYTFTGATDGSQPSAGVTRDSSGNLYGTTPYGGLDGAAGHGVVYKLDATGTETALYSFTGGADGSGPLAGVIRDDAGNLFGTTNSGGNGSQ
jgi:uncharacterized repeat protein (TIGR03803 family)